LHQRRDGLRIALDRQPAAEPVLAEPPVAGRFLFEPGDIAGIVAELQARLPEQAARILQQAEKIRRGRFDLLGYEDLDFGEPIDWQLDPVSGRRAPLVPWYRVPYLDYVTVGDHKVTWELNRHQSLVTLAKAWWLRRDDGDLAALCGQWRDWVRANPYGVGINWASSLEVAFRSLSWLWVLHLLPPSGPVPPEFRSEVITELGRAAGHIERYLSTYFAPNTHLLGEAAALFFVGTLCPQFRSAGRWRELGWAILTQQAGKQVGSDGLHFEQSVYYHVYALDFFLHARLLASRNAPPGAAQETALDGTIERMADALQTLAQAGDAPRFGDDDGGRLFDGSRNRSAHLSDPLAACAALFDRADFKAACPQMPEETVWLLGAAGARKHDALTAAAPRARSQWFEASGLACMASLDPLPHTLIVDAGVQGFGNAGHGHADALSVQLIVGGHSALTDPGTYCYPVEVSERNVFRGTAAHNTLEVDGLDQAEPGGSFDWRTQPRVRAERWVEGRGGALLVASHDGYARLNEPVTHRRWVAALGEGLYVVRDVAAGDGTHALCVRWHLGPSFRASGPGAPAESVPDHEPTGGHRLRFEGPDDIAVHLLAAEDGANNASCRSEQPKATMGRQAAGSRVTEGPWSEAYGRKSEASVVCWEKRTTLPAEFATAIAVSSATASGVGCLEALRSRPGELSVYRYSDGRRCMLLFCNDGEAPWRWYNWSSDAAFVVIETDETGREGRRVFLAGGSFMEAAKGKFLVCERQVDCWEWLRSKEGEQVFCSEPEAVEQATAAEQEFFLLNETDPT
jgi:hypothetical protein